jgi:hypothetical protein
VLAELALQLGNPSLKFHDDSPQLSDDRCLSSDDGAKIRVREQPTPPAGQVLDPLAHGPTAELSHTPSSSQSSRGDPIDPEQLPGQYVMQGFRHCMTNESASLSASWG